MHHHQPYARCLRHRRHRHRDKENPHNKLYYKKKLWQKQQLMHRHQAPTLLFMSALLLELPACLPTRKSRVSAHTLYSVNSANLAIHFGPLYCSRDFSTQKEKTHGCGQKIDCWKFVHKMIITIVTTAWLMLFVSDAISWCRLISIFCTVGLGVDVCIICKNHEMIVAFVVV